MATPGLAAFAAAVKSALDDLMLERGFARGQGGHDSPGPVDIIYCTALTDFRERWPRVFAALVQEVDLSSQLELLGGRIAHLLPT